MTVLIAGGGIGGLTLALSLHQIGIPAKVFESVPVLKPLGVGINVLPHAVRELIELGLLDQLNASGVRTKELAFFSKHGKPIWSEPRGLEAGYKWPQFSIHRGTLQQILLDAATERLGADNILTSHHLADWSETSDSIRADFIDKATGKPAGSYDGRLLIAADGIHSAIREKLYPQEGPPIWNGRILWRGITTSDAFLSGRTMIMAGHEILKFVCYPISKEPDAGGKFQINWVAERHMPPTYQWRREDYNRAANLEEFLPWFADWKFDWLDVPGLIRNCPHAYEYPLVDRDPVDRWTFGNVTLMGDAAHPMYPIGSNGASQAILDARTITREILAHGPTRTALAAYEAERRPATTELVKLNRRNGPEQVMQMVEERAPDGFKVVTDVLSQRELEDIAANYKRVAGFQVDGLNAKPPIVQARNPSSRASSAESAALILLIPPPCGEGGTLRAKRTTCRVGDNFNAAVYNPHPGLRFRTMLRIARARPTLPAGEREQLLQPMCDHLAHDIRQRFVMQGRDRHPAHAFWRAGALRNGRGINHKLEREMREDVVDHAELAMPARNGFQQRRLRQCDLVVLTRKPIRRRHLGHAAEQAFLGSGANQQLAAARYYERRAAPQRASLLRRLARKGFLIAAR